MSGDPLVMVIGRDLDAVAEVAGDLEAWGHDPIVHFDVNGAASTVVRVRPDVVVVVGHPAREANALVGKVGGARLIAYHEGGADAVGVLADVRVATSPTALRRLVEGDEAGSADLDAPVAGAAPVPLEPEVDDRPDAGSDVTTNRAGPAGWVRVLVAAAVLVIVASLLFAPPSEEIEVMDDLPVAEEVAEGDEVEPALDLASLGIATVAPEAPVSATPGILAAGRSGFGGVVVFRDGGSPVVDARVVVTGPSGTLETRADGDGRWRVSNVREGMYAIVASSPGYEGAPVQILVGEGQSVNGVRVVLGEGTATR